MDLQPVSERQKLCISAVSLTKARSPKNTWKHEVHISRKLSEEIIASGFIEKAPFSRIGIMIRYGLVNEDKPHYQRIDKKYNELPLAIEIDTHDLLNAKGNDVQLYKVLYRPVLLSLIDVARKYKLDGSYFEAELAKLENEND
jgi:hypothetical protein